jgi:hypothetical protein
VALGEAVCSLLLHGLVGVCFQGALAWGSATEARATRPNMLAGSLSVDEAACGQFFGQ